jgi:uncharacterized protein YjbI with pentapeptide repeats
MSRFSGLRPGGSAHNLTANVAGAGEIVCEAELAGAELAGAELAGAELAGAELAGAELAGAEPGS